jgi:tRNA threonylcarbamoyladenosine biosynthesis protein TsaB
MFYYFCESIRGVDEKSGILLCGNGAFKTTNGELPENVVLKEPYFCSAAHLAALAEAKFQQADFQDVLYYEPFYMKPPNITTAKKPL